MEDKKIAGGALGKLGSYELKLTEGKFRLSLDVKVVSVLRPGLQWVKDKLPGHLEDSVLDAIMVGLGGEKLDASPDQAVAAAPVSTNKDNPK